MCAKMPSSVLWRGWLITVMAGAEQWWSSRWKRVVQNTSIELAELLAEYPAVSSAERAKGLGRGGRFVTVVADHHGLGNRIGPIIGGFALALVTGRALAIHWPRRQCNTTKNHSDCDPASIDDLFQRPAGVSWALPQGHKLSELCANGRWLVHGNSPATVDELRTTSGLGTGPDFRAHVPNMCVDSDREFSWGVTCHDDLRLRFPSPWVASGAMMTYLLRPNSIVEGKLSATKRRHAGVSCALAVHLRKVDRGKLSSQSFTRAAIAAFYVASSRTGETGVYLASDDRSLMTRRVLVNALKDTSAVLLAPVTSLKATRGTVDGIQIALAENLLLSTCYDLFPPGTGTSTFHDVALARLVFEQQWPQSRINHFVNKYTPPGPHKFALAPAECPPAA